VVFPAEQSVAVMAKHDTNREGDNQKKAWTER